MESPRDIIRESLWSLSTRTYLQGRFGHTASYPLQDADPFLAKVKRKQRPLNPNPLLVAHRDWIQRRNGSPKEPGNKNKAFPVSLPSFPSSVQQLSQVQDPKLRTFNPKAFDPERSNATALQSPLIQTIFPLHNPSFP